MSVLLRSTTATPERADLSTTLLEPARAAVPVEAPKAQISPESVTYAKPAPVSAVKRSTPEFSDALMEARAQPMTSRQAMEGTPRPADVSADKLPTDSTASPSASGKNDIDKSSLRLPPQSEIDYVVNNFDHRYRIDNLNQSIYIRSKDNQYYTTRDGHKYQPLFTSEFSNKDGKNIHEILIAQKYPLHSSGSNDFIPYNASTVSYVQSALIGVNSPDIISMPGVTNKQTLSKISGKSGDNLLSSFLDSPNGKHTKYTAAIFNKKVSSVDIKNGAFGSAAITATLSDIDTESPGKGSSSGLKRTLPIDDTAVKYQRLDTQPGTSVNIIESPDSSPVSDRVRK
ncbi:hypothetical protein [Paraburkholderia heleia]|uniref:hypothetical protein n=1 Tax=Paraburkholderia heleia TaxID=634127 RepID=UPI002AB61C59|nr:hypothetical protein [Paraburkholderia heleia]